MEIGKHGVFTFFLLGMGTLGFFVSTPPAVAETSALAQVTGYKYHVLFTGTFYEPDHAPAGTRRA